MKDPSHPYPYNSIETIAATKANALTPLPVPKEVRAPLAAPAAEPLEPAVPADAVEEPPEPAAPDALLPVEPVVEVLFEDVAFAAAWNASNDFAAVGLTANTIP